MLLDVGANVGCKPEHIAQFAVMGAVYAEEVLGLARPRVGVLSVGEEDGKGSATTKEAAQALRDLDLNFLGNAEGRDIWNGKFDVIACDGFVGNAILKSSEALAEGLLNGLTASFMESWYTKLGGLLALPGPAAVQEEAGLRRIRRRPAAGGQGHHHHRPRPEQRPRGAQRHPRRLHRQRAPGQRAHPGVPGPAAVPGRNRDVLKPGLPTPASRPRRPHARGRFPAPASAPLEPP